MQHKPVYIGATPGKEDNGEVTGAFVTREGETYYRMADADRMRAFFMSIVSDADHWMFLSSNGALTAGRKNPDNALFPYSTDDKIHDALDLTGSKTLVLAEQEGRLSLWEPFSDRYRGVYDVQRNVYKSVYGNKVVFEEVNRDLSLTFSYAWSNSERFGFVKQSSLRNHRAGPVRVRLLDGIQNVLPCGVERAMQNERSTLVDAYKKNELLPDTGLGLFVLSSILVDKPEPSEALKATTVWSAGLSKPTYLLSSLQLDRFRQGLPLAQEIDVRAERGAYFVHTTLDLAPDASQDWVFVAEVNQGPAEVVALRSLLEEARDLLSLVAHDVAEGTRRLKHLVAQADGLQVTEDDLSTTRHFSNVLFNIMRGGIFDDHYAVGKADLLAFLTQQDRPVAARHEAFLQALPETAPIGAFLHAAAGTGDAQLQRLCYEYLPLTFSRRHGDPSRPWNAFSIETRKEDGSKNLHYEGNWRDIFQNWEALGRAYPGFTESMIAKFVNASTPDGYNPYRITRDGIDWEVLDPHDAWSYIGYWGDHQIIYLLKLLEISRAHHPGLLARFLTKDLFAYANVPYRIKPYRALLQDPHDTITYDKGAEAHIAERVAAVGADGKLVWGDGDAVYLVNLTEKLLVSVLAKFSNFIPEGGIWMNTQRPEWNDANNALVGNGVSMVTLYYLRRFQQFCADLFAGVPTTEIALSEEVADLFSAVSAVFMRYESLLSGPLSDRDRKRVLDALGEAGEVYRERVYAGGFSGRRQPVQWADLRAFFTRSLAFIDHTIRANRRPDGLYHAYNLMSVQDEGVKVETLYEMLEGQVAVLSSGLLSARESLSVLAALKASALYREDQNSYLLYPDRRLPRFVEKNNIPSEKVSASPLLQRLLDEGDRRLVVRDVRGGFHFNGAFHNATDVAAVLDELSVKGQERAYVLDLFEAVFDHRSYTGRSGTFYGYEGLGCIYWHMVSKLLLAVEETYERAIEAGETAEVLGKMVAYYYGIRAGIGLNKTPAVYGAFPTDPYSHTPGNRGARQPGMTGQVKEDILARWGELGVRVSEGRIRFEPALLRKAEFLSAPTTFAYFDLAGAEQALPLETGMLAFTYCQVPLVYRLSDQARITVSRSDGTTQTLEGLDLDAASSTAIFERQGEIRMVEVALQPRV